jgi:hypothetical protein
MSFPTCASTVRLGKSLAAISTTFSP